VRATFPVVHDVKQTVSNAFNVVPLPANFVIDRTGRVVFNEEGASLSALEAAVAKAVGTGGASAAAAAAKAPAKAPVKTPAKAPAKAAPKATPAAKAKK
jgi:peroxiredoxin Q/BCP